MATACGARDQRRIRARYLIIWGQACPGLVTIFSVPAFQVYQRGESLPDPTIPVSQTQWRKQEAASPALRLPPSSSTADTARPTCAADGSAWGIALYGRRIVSGGGWRCRALWQRANGDPACGGTSDDGRAARRVALSAGIRWTTRAARTVREHCRVRSVAACATG